MPLKTRRDTFGKLRSTILLITKDRSLFRPKFGPKNY
jgi:hypothetical protein